MFKLGLFQDNLHNVLKNVKPISIPDRSITILKATLVLISECENVFFNKSGTLDLKDDVSESIDKCQKKAEVILDITWEQLNVGCWKDVDISWRYVYSYASLFKVLCFLVKKNFQEEFDRNLIREVIKACDMGILMGAPILNNILSQIATEIMSFNNKTEVHSVSHSEQQPKVKKSKIVENIDLSNKVEEFKWLPCQKFESTYVKLQKPVIISNATKHWPAMKKWSVDYMLEKARYRLVPVEIGSKYTDENWTQKLMTLEEFVFEYIYKEHNNQNVGYLAQHDLFSQIPELMNDIKVPIYIKTLWQDNVEVDINSWFGPSDTVSPLHFDPKHNFLVQVMGEKYIKLYDKENSKFLYPREDTILDNTSQVDVENPDLKFFPLFAKAKHEDCILKPGSMLYIPPGYWHFVRSLSTSFSVSFWW